MANINDDIDRLRKEVDQLKKELITRSNRIRVNTRKNQLQKFAKTSIDRIDGILKQLKEATSNPLSYEYPSELGGSQDLAGFLTSLGESLVISQENLDLESMKYVSRLKGRNQQGAMIPPTVFRIPKMKASLKLGLEKTESDKLNVLIVSNEEESRSLNEQTVELEIAAVPASAELLHSLDLKVPNVQFVLSPNERSSVFEAIRTAIDIQAINKEHYGDLLKARNEYRVLMWQTPMEDESKPDQIIILHAGTGKGVDKKRDFGIWNLKMTDPPKLESIVRYDLAPRSVNQELLYDFVSRLANIQENLLRK